MLKEGENEYKSAIKHLNEIKYDNFFFFIVFDDSNQGMMKRYQKSF